MKRLALVLILVAVPALADEAPQATHPTITKPADLAVPNEPPKTLTLDEGRALYKLGMTEAAARPIFQQAQQAQAAVQAAQQEAKSAIEKITPPKP